MSDPRVEAIRANKHVGRGSCSSIDEAMTDEEIIRDLDDSDIKTPEEAVKWAVEREDLWLEKGTNQRWGEDNDPQIKDHQNFIDKINTSTKPSKR